MHSFEGVHFCIYNNVGTCHSMSLRQHSNDKRKVTPWRDPTYNCTGQKSKDKSFWKTCKKFRTGYYKSI